MTTTQPLPYASRAGDARIGQGVPNHARQAVEGAAYDFFAPPPDGIGELRSAESTLKAGREPWPMPVHWAAALAAGVVLSGAFWALAAQEPRPSERNEMLLVGATVAGLTVLVWVAYAAFRRRTCSYVGTDGVARVSVLGRRDGATKVERLIFADAAELRAAQVRQHYNGVYVGTNYDYRWTGHDGRRLFRLKGTYRAARKKRPKAVSPFHFARSAEMAWSEHYLARAQASLKAEGSIPFRVDNKRWVRVGPGFLEFHFGGEPTRVDKADIAKVTLGNGTFAFQHRDAKWFSRAGKYAFQYGSMANAQVFLLALDRLLGYRWN